MDLRSLTTPHPMSGTLIAYLAAIAAAAAALTARFMLMPWVGLNYPLMPLILAPLIGFWFGTRSALLASLLCVLGGSFLFLEPRYQFTVADPADVYRLLLLAVTSIALSFAGGRRLSVLQAAQERHLQTLEDAREREKAQISERRQRGRLATILAGINDAVIITDTQGNIVSMNQVAEALACCSQDECLGQPLRSMLNLTNGETRTRVPDPVHKALTERRSAGPLHCTMLIKRSAQEKDEERMIEYSTAPIQDEQNLLGAVLIFRDITERRHEQRRQQFLTDLAHATQALGDPRDVVMTSSQLLAEHLAVDRCAYAEVEKESVFVITGDYTRGVPSIVGEWPVAAFGAECVRCMLANEPFVINDVDATPLIFDADKAAYRATNIQAVVCVPLHKKGRLTGAMAVHQTSSRHWRAEEIELVCAVAERCWESLERARALRQLQDSEEKFRNLADNISQLAWMTDEKGNAIWYNQRWMDYTGTSIEELAGQKWKRVQHPDHLERVVKHFQECLDAGRHWEDTLPIKGKDGEYRWFLSHASPIRNSDGRTIRWFGTNTDITELRDLQEELRQAAERLSADDQRKNEFLATLAHELRNPLAPIQTGLEIVKRLPDIPPKLDQIHAMFERQTRQLVKLVDDLLDISRITQGRLELRRTRIQLGDVVEIALETARPLIDAAHQQLHIDMPESSVPLEADLHRLAQVLANLLNNASKYTPEQGQIWLRAAREGESLILSVRDSGIGIPPDKLDYIFEMFGQVDRPLERGYTGLGIGLTLSRSLIEMHGGRIEVASPGANMGSEFKITLPIARTYNQLDNPPRQPAPGTVAPRRILVVDDNSAAVETLSSLIRLDGHAVRTAADGREAIAAAAEFKPEIIIMDLGMPRMNGYEAAVHIREQRWGQGIRLIALSGWGQEADKQRTRQAGFDFHLVKPVTMTELQKYLDLSTSAPGLEK